MGILSFFSGPSQSHLSLYKAVHGLDLILCLTACLCDVGRAGTIVAHLPGEETEAQQSQAV